MDNATYRILMWPLRLMARLPLRLLYPLSTLACFFLYRLVGYRRKVVAANLKRCFPEASPEQLRLWEREFYHHLCDIFIEAFKLLHISDREMSRRVEVRGIEAVNAVVDSGRSVVVMIGHYGNWEWVTYLATKLNRKATLAQIYHPLSNKFMDRLMLTLRGRFGSKSLPMASAVRSLLQMERRGEHFVCGFIADQRPFTRELKHWTCFLGQDTPYVVGGESIGNHIGADFYYLDIEPLKRGHYRMTFKPIIPPADDTEPNPVTRQYLSMLEATIRRAPQYWLWSHKRWKRQRPIS